MAAAPARSSAAATHRRYGGRSSQNTGAPYRTRPRGRRPLAATRAASHMARPRLTSPSLPPEGGRAPHASRGNGGGTCDWPTGRDFARSATAGTTGLLHAATASLPAQSAICAMLFEVSRLLPRDPHSTRTGGHVSTQVREMMAGLCRPTGGQDRRLSALLDSLVSEHPPRPRDRLPPRQRRLRRDRAACPRHRHLRAGERQSRHVQRLPHDRERPSGHRDGRRHAQGTGGRGDRFHARRRDRSVSRARSPPWSVTSSRVWHGFQRWARRGNRDRRSRVAPAGVRPDPRHRLGRHGRHHQDRIDRLARRHGAVRAGLCARWRPWRFATPSRRRHCPPRDRPSQRQHPRIFSGGERRVDTA